MDVPSPQQRPAVLARYQQWRAIGRELNKKLVESLSGDDINEAGELLGLLHKGVLFFDTEDTVAVLMEIGRAHV